MGDEVRLPLVAIVSLTLTLFAVPQAVRLAHRLDLLDSPGGWKTHAGRTPYLGGAAIFAAFAPVSLLLSPDASRFLPLLAAALLCLVVGTVDDARGLSPSVRILTVSATAVALHATGLGWALFSSGAANLLVTIAWCLGVVNAINLLDLMDGAASSVAAVSAAGICVLAAILGDSADAVVAASLCGGCLGFLRYNLRSPASIFLGDGGTMSIGLVLAGTVMALPFKDGLGALALVPGVLLLGVPVFDMTFRVLSRLRMGVPLMHPGPDSIANWLSMQLSSTRLVATVLGLSQATLCAIAITASGAGDQAALVIAAGCSISGALLIGVLMMSGFGPQPAMDYAAQSANGPSLRRPRIFQLIARLNVGGATIQAITLARVLEPRYETTLLRGTEGAREGNMNQLADSLGVRPVLVPGLRRELGFGDLRALIAVTRAIRRERPVLLHTHTAKAGTIGRVAALLAGRRRPRIVVHTFHGHVLSGYFSRSKTFVFSLIERVLAKATTRLITVSAEVKRDLLSLGVGTPESIEVIRVGFDFSAFDVDESTQRRHRSQTRRELAIPEDALVVTTVGRVVPIKRIDRFLRIANLLSDIPGIRFLVVGDGEQRGELASSPAARQLGKRLVWAGFRDNVAPIYFASDLVALTSDNEGTPVSLIEAQAAGVPVVCTDVGGVRETVLENRTGRIVNPALEDDFADAIREILDDSSLGNRLGYEGKRHSRNAFSLHRMVTEVEDLYARLLSAELARPVGPGAEVGRSRDLPWRSGRSRDQTARAMIGQKK